MWWWLRELSTCFRFLSVSGDNGFWRSKRVYEIVLPIVLSVAAFVLYLLFPGAFPAGVLGRFLDRLFQFMVFVVPFHLAALAAFATFERHGLDEPLKGTNAEIRVWNNKENDFRIETLTLRQYASLLFGYLCVIGIVFVIGYVFVINIDFHHVLGSAYDVAYKIAILLTLLFVTHYSILSSYAITFLFDKVNKIGESARTSREG